MHDYQFSLILYFQSASSVNDTEFGNVDESSHEHNCIETCTQETSPYNLQLMQLQTTMESQMIKPSEKMETEVLQITKGLAEDVKQIKMELFEIKRQINKEVPNRTGGMKLSTMEQAAKAATLKQWQKYVEGKLLAHDQELFRSIEVRHKKNYDDN